MVLWIQKDARTMNDDDRQVDDSGGAVSTLSKRLLYTPLKAIETGSTTSIPKSLNEGSLVKFCRNTTVDYHRSLIPSKNAKNGGSRPLGTNDIEERIRHRIVSLLGSSKRGPKNVTKAANSSKRKRKHQRDRRKARNTIPGTAKEQHAFVDRIRSEWQTYAKSILSSSKKIDSNHLVRISSILPKLELIGATVSIDSCSEQSHLEGQEGVIVGVTKNTWILAIETRKPKQTTEEITSSFKLVTVGKRSTVLSFSLQLSASPSETLNKVRVIVTDSSSYAKYIMES